MVCRQGLTHCCCFSYGKPEVFSLYGASSKVGEVVIGRQGFLDPVCKLIVIDVVALEDFFPVVGEVIDDFLGTRGDGVGPFLILQGAYLAAAARDQRLHSL